jgi:hypothetical protein
MVGVEVTRNRRHFRLISDTVIGAKTYGAIIQAFGEVDLS